MISSIVRLRKFLGYQKWFWFQGGRASTAYPRAVARLQRSSTRLLSRLHPIHVHASAPTSIHLLCGHAQTSMAIFALHSFLRHAGSRDRNAFSATVHSDGSLTAADRATLARHFPNITVLEKHAGHEVVHSTLPGDRFAHLRAFRDTHLFGPKLLDPHLTSTANCLLLLDTDILFFRPPTELLARLDATPSDRHLTSFRDAGPFYSASPDDLEQRLGLRPVPALNAGLVAMPRFGTEDFLLLNELLSKMPREWVDNNFFAEQTLYALLATVKGWHPLPASYQIAPGNPDATTALHYVSCARKEFFTDGIPHLLAGRSSESCESEPGLAAAAPHIARPSARATSY